MLKKLESLLPQMLLSVNFFVANVDTASATLYSVY